MDGVQQGIDAVRQHIPIVDEQGKTVQPGPSIQALDTFLGTCEEIRQCGTQEDASTLLQTLRTRLDKAHTDITEANRHYYVALNKLWRAVDKKFPTSLDSLIDPKLFSSEKCTYALDTAMIDYLFRAGHFDVASMFSEETGVHVPESQRTAIAELRTLSAALETGNTQPILHWASAHGEALRARNSSLEYFLLRSQFLGIAQGDLHFGADTTSHLVEGATTNAHLAFLYGRRYFAPYFSTHLDEIQRLYALLLYLPKFPVSVSGVPLDDAPDPTTLLSYVPLEYRDMLTSLRTDMKALGAQFRADFCALAHLPQLCPLQASADVGANNALGRINKVRNVMKDRGNEWSQADELPVCVFLLILDRNPPPAGAAAAQHVPMPGVQGAWHGGKSAYDDAMWTRFVFRHADSYCPGQPCQVSLLSC